MPAPPGTGWAPGDPTPRAAPPPDGFLFRFPADGAEVRFCFAIPYVEANLRQFLDRHGDSSALRTGVLCKTAKGRSAEVLHAGRLDGPSDYRLAFTCRHHACESVASFVLEGLMESILAQSETGRWFRRVAVAAIPFVDKDGVEAGDQGKNRKPHDHNRDYAGEASIPRWPLSGGFCRSGRRAAWIWLSTCTAPASTTA